MISGFLPAGWSDDTPLILLAGQGEEGSYPYELAERALVKKAAISLLALKDETSPAVMGLFDPREIRIAPIGDLGALLKAIKELGGKGLIMAGRVDTGHVFKDFFPDFRAIALMAGLKERNAETIIGAIAGEIEKINVQVLDARTFMDDSLADEGWMVKNSESVSAEAIEHAVKIAEGVAQLDIGQSVVTRKGTVLAAEGFEGTDAMLARCAGFKTDHKIFAKTVKARQDYRFDVPIFGLKTLESLAAANIRTAVLKKGSVIIPQKEAVLACAKREGIAVFGY